MSLGKRLKRLRVEKGLSQLEMAKALAISNVTLSQYESESRKPDIETLKRLSAFFNVSADYLLFEQTPTPSVSQSVEAFTSPEDAMRFLLEQNVIMGFGGFDINELSDTEIIEFANELLTQLKLVSYKYKK